ncbi:FtsX-like permease family protein [Arthrobacter sp. ok362]|uniref:ABC transporter permease n=1 Tax=Arthrobacter sp. ok362 TaxID=1761745 RepID=UPI0008868533|nr:FtsX-like permease family protein [Arthrobacter sp. ok362]SDK60097.1 FtsX-like permease family protein [Arthrobacter sp. ok362]
MTRGTSLRALLGRQFSASRGASVLVAVLILVMSFLLSVWPRAVEGMLTADIQKGLSQASPSLRNPSTNSSRLPLLGPGQGGTSAGFNSGAGALDSSLIPLWGAMDEATEAVRQRAPEPLRSALGRGQYLFSVSKLIGSPESAITIPGIKSLTANIAFDPRIQDNVTISQGRTPHALAVPEPQDRAHPAVPTAPMEVMAAPETAERMHWAVGQEYKMPVGLPGMYQAIRLTGIFVPKNPDEDFWAVNGFALQPRVTNDPESGDAITGRVYANPASVSFMDYAGFQTTQFSTQVWFPLLIDNVSANNGIALLSQLKAFENTDQTFDAGPDANAYFIQRVRFDGTAPDILNSSLIRASSTNAVLAMLATGPLGVCAAAMALSIRLLLERRRRILVLAAARGASSLQLRGAMAIESLSLGVPAAAGGMALAIYFTPATLQWQHLLLPACLVVAPALLTAAMKVDGDRRHLKRSPNRWRLAAECAVMILAILAVYELLQPQAGNEINPLAILTPLLLSGAVSVIVLRLYPLPIAVLERRGKRSIGLAAFLGSARTLRSPAGGLTPILAVVLGAGIILFSGVLYGTLRDGVQEVAEIQVGAQVSLHGPGFTPEQVRRTATLAGVAAVSQVTDFSSVSVTVGDRVIDARLILIDARKFATVTAGIPAVLSPEQMGELTTAAHGTIPIAASASLNTNTGATGTITLGTGVPVNVIALGPAANVLTSDPKWVVADADTFKKVAPQDLLPNQLLMKLTPGADSAAVADAIRKFGWRAVSVESIQERSAEIRSRPIIGGLQLGLVMIVVFVWLLCALTVVMTSVANAPPRNRLIVVLRALGAPKSTDKYLLVWEFLPVTVAACAGGTVLGLLLSWVISNAVDLRVFTGGLTQPPVSIDWPVLAVLMSGFLLTVAGAFSVASWGGRVRTSETEIGVEGNE